MNNKNSKNIHTKCLTKHWPAFCIRIFKLLRFSGITVEKLNDVTFGYCDIYVLKTINSTSIAQYKSHLGHEIRTGSKQEAFEGKQLFEHLNIHTEHFEV